MKKLFALVLAGVMAMSMIACGGDAEETTVAEETTAAAGEITTVVEGKLTVATEAGFAPYEYMVGDEIVGVDMDIAQAIADELGMELVIQNMDFDATLVELANGKVDIVAAGLSVDPERAEMVDFSVNYVDSTEVVVVNAAAPTVTEPTGAALADKVIGVQLGNIADLWVSNADNASPKEIMRYTKFAQAAEDLKNAKIDAIVMDELPAKELVASSDGTLMILEGDPLFIDQYAVAVGKGNTALLDTVNKVITELQESGKMDEIIASHGSAE